MEEIFAGEIAPSPAEILGRKIKELGMPQVRLTFAFTDGTVVDLPILSRYEHAKDIDISITPTFETQGYMTVLTQEEFTITVGYGEGVIP